MAALDPAVAAVRVAVRSRLRSLDGDQVMVACSGGADSMALAAATAFVAPRLGLRAGLITVDHQLQAGSDQRAEAVAAWAREAGLTPAVVCPVEVRGPGGPEAAARAARYEALVRVARAHGAGTVLLAHTQDDQAETVLLALLRGAGSRGLAAMPARRDLGGVALVRPLLGVSRAQTRAACAAQNLVVWDDPHNHDPAYARVRARALLESMAKELGPGVVANLTRTAELAAADAAALDALAQAQLAAAIGATGELRVAGLAALPDAVRGRVLHAWARGLGVPGAALAHRHVRALDALIMSWHGQREVWLPGGVAVRRRDGCLVSAAPTGSDPHGGVRRAARSAMGQAKEHG